MILIEYLAFAVIVVSYNLLAGTFNKIKTPFFLLSACTEEILSTSNFLKFQPNPSPFYNKNFPYLSNPALYLESEYLSGSTFSVNSKVQIKNFLI